MERRRALITAAITLVVVLVGLYINRTGPFRAQEVGQPAIVRGQVTAINNTSLTVQSTDLGPAYTIVLTPGTLVFQFSPDETPATAEHIAVGDTVVVVPVEDRADLTREAREIRLYK